MMKKIIVLSDTHIPVTSPRLPQEVLAQLKNADYIFHAGDFVEYSFYETLAKHATLYAVAGNMDEHRIIEAVPRKQLIEIEGKTFGIIHGWGPAAGIIERIREEFPRAPDVIVYGHTHQTFNERVGGVLFFNPGSPTDTVFAKKRTFGILEIDNDIHARLITLP
jgi:hypothetical protein